MMSNCCKNIDVLTNQLFAKKTYNKEVTKTKLNFYLVCVSMSHILAKIM